MTDVVLNMVAMNTKCKHNVFHSAQDHIRRERETSPKTRVVDSVVSVTLVKKNMILDPLSEYCFSGPTFWTTLRRKFWNFL